MRSSNFGRITRGRRRAAGFATSSTGATPVSTTGDSPYFKTTLENGVRVVSGPMSGVRSASLIIYYNVGSRFEPPQIGGVSHFLEHMLFKGTERRPDPAIISEAIESVGGSLNAATGRESTSYWVKVPSTHFELAFDVLADMMRGTTFEPAEYDKERKVIFEEIRSIQDMPEDLVHDVIDEVVWGDSELGRPIAGTEETVGATTRETMIDYWRRNYSPDRLIVAAGGDLRHEDAVALTERYFGDLEPVGTPNTFTPAVEDQRETRIRLVDRETEQAHICLGFPALPYTTERRFAQSTIEAILSGGMSSRLFQEIREKRGLVYSVYGYFRPYEDVGQGVIYAGTDLERVEETVGALTAELRKLRDEPVPEDELERTKTLRKGRLLMGLEDSRSVASWVGGQEATYGEIKTPEEIMEEIDSVTVAQVQELADELFRPERYSLAVIGPYRDEKVFRDLLNG